MSRHVLHTYIKKLLDRGVKNNASWELSGDVKLLFAFFWLVIAVCFNAVVPTNAQVNVTQFHNHESRDGLYIDAVFSQSAAVNLVRDPKFDGTIVGNVYAQPLYIENGPGGQSDDHYGDGIE